VERQFPVRRSCPKVTSSFPDTDIRQSVDAFARPVSPQFLVRQLTGGHPASAKDLSCEVGFSNPACGTHFHRHIPVEGKILCRTDTGEQGADRVYGLVVSDGPQHGRGCSLHQLLHEGPRHVFGNSDASVYQGPVIQHRLRSMERRHIGAFEELPDWNLFTPK